NRPDAGRACPKPNRSRRGDVHPEAVTNGQGQIHTPPPHRLPTPQSSHRRTRASVGRGRCAASSSWFSFTKHETDAPDRMNQFHWLIEIDFAAESGDVNVNDIIQRSAPSRFLPYFARQCITQDDLALVPQ